MARVLFCFALVALSTCTSSTSALKILGISTVPSHSHHIWFTTLMNGLARNGHQIWAIGLEPTKFDVMETMENQTTSIVFEGKLGSFKKKGISDSNEWAEFNPIKMARFIWNGSHELCEKQVATKGAKQILELVKNTEIDVIVQDVTVGQCFYGLIEVAKGNPTIVGFTPFGAPNWIKDIVGGNDWPAIKQFLLYHDTAPFSLWQKTLNLIYYEVDNILRQYWHMPEHQKLAEKYIGKKLSKSLSKIEKQINVLLLNSYPALEPAIFLPPNAIEVGGLQISDPKPLPKDIKEFLDGAEHGVVVISLGTNVRTSILGTEKLKAIVTALGKLKQRVLWKFDSPDMPGQPKNVMIQKWLPQISDVLAHPNVRVFWSHCGLLSTQEAIWRGVPMIGMPFYMDQFPNIDILAKKGVALRLDFESITTERVSETLNKILNDTSFASKMKQLSLEYKDRPMSPLDLAVWHVEHASRHPRGMLASPGRDLNRAQLNLLDVYAVLGLGALAVFFLSRYLLRTSINALRSQKKTKTA